MAITYSEDGSVKKRKGNKKALALNAGPSSPIKYYPGLGYRSHLGGAGLNDKKIRFKKPILPPV
tara:strand:+ start:347 stop:538 length:192 start_codon:yes stop_codon:yes gene_type:complete